MSNANYTFLPWLRRGVAAGLTGQVQNKRASVPLKLIFKQKDGQQQPYQASTQLELVGPGEVTGLDQRTVIRTWPPPEHTSAETNYFPLVEFDQPDLPWRYTPMGADLQNRLLPWLCLIVLPEDSFEYRQPGRECKLSSIVIDDIKADETPLPDPTQAWAWAHVQVSGHKGTDVAQLLERHPERLVSRLLCPCHLLAKTRYAAFVVPTFMRGREAGLGKPVTADSDKLAWEMKPGKQGVELPIYFEWRFVTGEQGDFEYLARKLEAQELPATVGVREMHVDNPGLNLPAASENPLGLLSALGTPQKHEMPWPKKQQRHFKRAIKTLLNLPAAQLKETGSRRLLAPPLYGRWHAAQQKLGLFPVPAWFHQLNKDPCLRVVAGIGTQVVQREQQALLASAWQQAEGILRLNEELRSAQTAREAACTLYNRDVALDDPCAVLELTAPLHGRIRNLHDQLKHAPTATTTVAGRLKHSPVPEGVFDVRFRNLTSKWSGHTSRSRHNRKKCRTLIERLNAGEFGSAPPLAKPENLLTLRRAIAPNLLSGGSVEVMEKFRPLVRLGMPLLGIGLMLTAVGLFLVGGGSVVASSLAVIGAASAGAAPATIKAYDSMLNKTALRNGKLTCSHIRNLPDDPEFQPEEPLPANSPPVSPENGQFNRQESVERFKQAACEALNLLSKPPQPGTVRTPARLDALSKDILDQLDPRKTIPASYQHRIQLKDPQRWRPKDPLEPVMVYPVFPQPMYAALAEVSQDWLLSGLDKVRPNTVGLVVSDQAVIEAYMLGLNHEMARELLWNGYPTDQRGSYFRQFWDTNIYLNPEGSRPDDNALKDIKEIHHWGNSALGNNNNRKLSGDKQVVLLIRGDLLRRYPNTLVYAVDAVTNKDKEQNRRELGTQERFPVFSGRLEPDIAFFGFDLTPDQVYGNDNKERDQGWFFVLQQQPTEPLFGMDDTSTLPATPLSSWTDLTWRHVVQKDADLEKFFYINLKVHKPKAITISPPGKWNADTGSNAACASDLAYITMQNPVRVAIHGSDMLFRKEGTP